jgi:hypothetical protein
MKNHIFMSPVGWASLKMLAIVIKRLRILQRSSATFRFAMAIGCFLVRKSPALGSSWFYHFTQYPYGCRPSSRKG